MKKDLKSEKKFNYNSLGNSLKYSKYFLFILGIIFIWGVFLRFYNLGVQSFWMDEGYSTIVSFFAYQNNFSPINPAGIYFYNYYLHTIFQVITFKLFGVSDFSARFFSVIFNLSTLLVLIIWLKEFLLSKGISKRVEGFGILILSFFYLFSYTEILWSRQARFYTLLTFLFILGLYLLRKTLILNKFKFIYPAIIVIGIGILFHPFFWSLAGFLAIFIFGRYINRVFRSDKNKSRFFIEKNLLIIITVLAISILFIYKTKAGLTILNSINDFSINGFLFKLLSYIYYLYNDSKVIFILYLLSFLYLLKTKDNKNFWFFSIIAVLNIVFISINNMFALRYIYHIRTILFLQSTIFIICAFNNYYRGKSIDIFRNIIIYLIIGLTIFFHNYQFLPINNYLIDYTAPQFDFKTAYEYINSKTYGKAKIVSGISSICLWYNRDDTSRCMGSYRINQAGNKKEEENIKKNKVEKYTAIKYFNNSSELPNEKIYFVTDDFSLMTIVDASFVDFIEKKCKIFWKKGKVTSGEGISVWECN